MSTNEFRPQERIAELTATELTDFADTDADADADRPADCACTGTRLEADGGLPCWPCYSEGFETPNPEPEP